MAKNVSYPRPIWMKHPSKWSAVHCGFRYPVTNNVHDLPVTYAKKYDDRDYWQCLQSRSSWRCDFVTSFSDTQSLWHHRCISVIFLISAYIKKQPHQRESKNCLLLINEPESVSVSLTGSFLQKLQNIWCIQNRLKWPISFVRPLRKLEVKRSLSLVQRRFYGDAQL